MHDTNLYHSTTSSYTRSQAIEATYVTIVRPAEPKKVVTEKVDIGRFFFLIILTTPNGEVEDLTDIDDGTSNFRHESQWASVPHPCFGPDESLLNPIYQGALVAHAQTCGLAHYFRDRRDRMIFESFEADMAKQNADKARLKAKEEAMIGIILLSTPNLPSTPSPDQQPPAFKPLYYISNNSILA